MARGASRAVLDHAGHVYGAARAACADPELAEAIAERVLTAAVRSPCSGRLERKRLVEEALVLAVRSHPAPPFDALPLDERETIALARLGGCSAQEIALLRETSIENVKTTMRRGLERLVEARRPAAAR
jgi:DNA-directed RNA polymerase specialized sigma24 family protein